MFFEGRMPTNELGTKRKSIKTSVSSGKVTLSWVETSSKRGVKFIDLEGSTNHKCLPYFFSTRPRHFHSRTKIHCLSYFKCHFSILFSEAMIGLFDFLFVCRSFLGVKQTIFLNRIKFWSSPLLVLQRLTYAIVYTNVMKALHFCGQPVFFSHQKFWPCGISLARIELRGVFKK